jgi:hypothetical protein
MQLRPRGKLRPTLSVLGVKRDAVDREPHFGDAYRGEPAQSVALQRSEFSADDSQLLAGGVVRGHRDALAFKSAPWHPRTCS